MSSKYEQKGKTMKKWVIMSMASLAIMATVGHAERTKEEIGRSMGQMWQDIFVLSPTKRPFVDVRLWRNLITEAPTEQEKERWYDQVREVGTYIKAHDDDLVPQYNKLVNLTVNIFNTLLKVYSQYIMPRYQTQKYDLKGIKDMIDPLAVNWKQAKAVLAELEAIKARTSKKKTQDALYLLIPFAEIIKQVDEQVRLNFDALERGLE